MTDVNAAIRSLLQGNATALATFGARMYGGRDVPPVEYDPTDGAAVCFRVRGGAPDYSDALHFPSVQFKVYGESEAEAEAAYEILFGAMQNASSGTILHAECETLGQALEEPDTLWRFVLTFFNVMLRQ